MRAEALDRGGGAPPLGAAEACAICGGTLPAVPLIRGADLLHGTEGSFAVHACPACGAGNTRPAISDAALADRYPDAYRPHGGTEGRLSRRLALLLLRRELRVGAAGRLRSTGPGRLLDVGCGDGLLGAQLAALGWRVDGIDPSAAAAERASSRGVAARAGTLDTVEVDAGAYDAVLFNHSLEHTNDPVANLKLARDALRPGGETLISVPNFACWARRRFGASWFHLDLPRHRVHFAPDAMRTALERADLELQELWTSTSPTGLVGSLQYRLLGGLAVSEGDARETLGYLVATLAIPAAPAEQALGGGRDFLHAVARRTG
jgi:SAM-dependent methyltransferase